VIAVGEERKSAGKRLIVAVIVIFINIVVFFVHWRVGRKATKEVLAA
jgi:divalent metal cation (Fe/Co/Zn/Cd) transporter